MGSAKHEKTFNDFDKAYESNIIGMRGILYFGGGLLILIVITFGLMWYLEKVMEDQAQATDAREKNLMMENVTKEDRLPPEPRLQAAPGFGVGEGKDRVNLELQAPQSEYLEMEKRWNKIEMEGQHDPNTGAVVTLPIEEAKQRLLQENVKAKSGAEAQKELEDSRTFMSYSSAGRMSSDKRR
ncbi:MAG: hypothetical protein ACR2L1_05000 [Pyrinomonadaceae bacterium]